MPDWRRSWHADWESWAVVALGTALVGSAALHPFLFADGMLVRAAETLVVAGAGTGTALVGLHIARRSVFDCQLRRRIAYWTFGATAALIAVAVSLTLIYGGLTTHEYVFALQSAAGVGMTGGAIAGYNEARAVVHARAAERAKHRERREREVRERLDFLNDLLRHDALNAAAVIEGYADLLGDKVADDAAAYVDTIAEQSRTITDLVNDVRVLVEAIEEPPELDTVDLVALVEEQAAGVERRREGVTVETETPAVARIRADDLLAALLRNLLTNAVEHHDGEHAHVAVRVRREGPRTVLEVADDGPGLPEHVRPPFTPEEGNHGRGLYLVHTLVERYDGRLDVEANEPRGTVFRISLESAPEPVEGEEPESETGTTGGTRVAAGERGTLAEER